MGFGRGAGSRYGNYFVLVACLALLVLAVVISRQPAGPEAEGPGTEPEMVIPAPDQDSELYKEIQRVSQEHRIEPIDARVDQIWKAIPGYNGLEIDVEASYAEMAPEGEFDANKLVFREIAPEITLGDLEPHPLYRGNPEKPMVAFLINVAWGNEYIPDMLQTLEDYELEATFFFDGSWVENNPELATRIYDAGHEIGNHAYSHPDLAHCSKAQTLKEIKKTNQAIELLLGIKPIWFAPPSGSFTETTVGAAHSLGMKTVLWTVDTIDWQNPDPREMVDRVTSQLQNGTMILMHPTNAANEGLGSLIKNIKGKGYLIGTVGELLDEKRAGHAGYL